MFLGDKPFENLESAEEYAHDAFSSANYLVLECLNSGSSADGGGGGDKISGHARHAANHLGKAQGLVTVLRATPYNAAR